MDAPSEIVSKWSYRSHHIAVFPSLWRYKQHRFQTKVACKQKAISMFSTKPHCKLILYGHWVAKWACRGHVTKTYRLWRIFLNKSALLSCLLQISQRSFDKSSFTKFQVITSPMEITRHILFFLILHIWAFYCYANVTSFKVRESQLN